MMKMTSGILFIILFAVHASFAFTGSGEREGIPLRTEALFLSERPPSGHEGHGSRRLPSEHSEHRASPVKRFYLNLHELSEDARAFVLRPDGSIKEATLNHDEGVWVVSFDTKPMDGSMDGIFNLYVIDKQMIDKTLLIRIAKMNVINHSCGWGHKFKFDKERLRPKYNDSVPLEVVAYDLWDRNFHSRSASGDRLLLSVLSYGKPVKADLRVRTEGGWMKSMKTDDDGRASFQLIREYYTERWRDFNSRKRTGLMITAQYEVQENGFYKGQPYERIRLITSLPWRYQVSRAEYSSYAYGLLILTIFSVASGLAVYLYRQRRRA